MAHHNSTPQSVLDAPTVTRVVLEEFAGYNRAQRRHVRLPNGRVVHRVNPRSYMRVLAETYYRRS